MIFALRRILLSLGTVVLVAVSAELGLRVYLACCASETALQAYAPLSLLEKKGIAARLVPHRYLGYVTAPGYAKGENRHNEDGFRGADLEHPKPDHVRRLVCLGGSTTYSGGVEDWKASYPYLLQRALHTGTEEDSIEVINAGVPGYSSLETLLNFQLRVLELKPDVIVICHGINDLHTRFVYPPSAYRSDQGGTWAGPARFLRAGLLDRSALLRWVGVRTGLLPPVRSVVDISPLSPTFVGNEFSRQTEAGIYPDGLFSEVSAEQVLAGNPPHFLRRNLESLLAAARFHGVTPVLVTFPVNEQAEGAPAYLRTAAFRTGMLEHNSLVREIARREGVLLVDLAAVFPDDPSLFTDGVHFTAEGNRIRAARIAEQLQPLLNVD